MPSEKTYLKKDLIDYKVDELDMDYEYQTYSRTTALDIVLPDEAEIYSVRDGRYQGELVLVVELDGYIWMAHDYYGSCSGCDYCMSNPVGWTDDMLRGMYCFPDVYSARQYLDNTIDFGYGIDDLQEQAEELLDKLS